MEQAEIYAIATAGLEDGSGPGIPSSAVDKVLQYVARVLFRVAARPSVHVPELGRVLTAG